MTPERYAAINETLHVYQHVMADIACDLEALDPRVQRWMGYAVFCLQLVHGVLQGTEEYA